MALSISGLARALLRGVRTWQEQGNEQEEQEQVEIKDNMDCMGYLQLGFSLLFGPYTAALVLGLTGVNTGNSFFLNRKKVLFMHITDSVEKKRTIAN